MVKPLAPKPIPVLQIRLDADAFKDASERAKATDLAPSAWGRVVIERELAGDNVTTSLTVGSTDSAPEVARLTAEVARLKAELDAALAEMTGLRRDLNKANATGNQPVKSRRPGDGNIFTRSATPWRPKKHAVNCSCGVCQPVKK